VYLITELLTGGELLEAVLKRGNYTEPEARQCFVQVLRGIEYLHSKYAAAFCIQVPAHPAYHVLTRAPANTRQSTLVVPRAERNER
jgi:serine/threonine protein kinase